MTISIIITAYNVEQYIKQTILSALNQKHIPNDQGDFDLEVIVVNDASTDSTGSVLSDIVAEHSLSKGSAPVPDASPSVRVITNQRNVGAGLSRRIGIEAAHGDYLLLLDGDDYLQPTFIASLAYSAQRYDADIVSGGITILRDEKVGYFDQTCYGNFIATGSNKVTNFYKERIVFMNNKLIRRSLHKQVPYCERRYIEDTPVIAKMLYLANKVVYTNNPGYVYRMQPQSLTHTSSQLKGDIFKTLCLMDLIDFYADKGKPYTDLFNLTQFYKLYRHLQRIPLEGETAEEIKLYPKEVATINDYAAFHLQDYKDLQRKEK